MMRDFLQIAYPLRHLFIYLALSISIPSSILYISQILTILRHRNFQNTFYFLFIARAIPDLLYLLNSFYGYRLPTILGTFLFPFYASLPNWLLAMYFFIAGFAFQADNLAMAFLLLNRFTAIAFPLHHEKLWHHLFPMALLLIFSLPIFFTYDSFLMVATLNVSEKDPSDPNRTSFHIYEQKNGKYLDKSTLTNAIFSLAFLLVCAFINLATLIAYKIKRNGLKMTTMDGGNKGTGGEWANGMERKLFLYALYTFIGHMAVAFLMILIWWYSRLDDSLALASLYSKHPLIVDFGTILLPSLLLFWASPSFRHQWVADFIPKKLAKFLLKNAEKKEINVAAGNFVRVSRNNIQNAIGVQSTMTSGFLRPTTSSFLGNGQNQQQRGSIVTISSNRF